MKLSVSIPDEDVAVLDDYAQRSGLSSRSAAVHRAIQLLRHPDLEDDYAAAWAEWDESGEGDVWGRASLDGLDNASR